MLVYKKPAGYIAALLALLIFFSVAAPAAAQLLTVDVNLLNVRSGPGTNHPILTQISRSTVITALEEEGSWARITLPDGSRGWIFAAYTSPFIPKTFANVNVALLNVRRGPGTGHGVVAQFTQNTAVAVLGEQDGWLNVLRPEGGQAWGAGWLTQSSPFLGYATVTPALLNLRSGPGTGFSILNQLSRGSEVASVGREGVWYRVVLDNGTTGWVHGSYISWSASEGSGANPAPPPAAPVEPAPPPAQPVQPTPPVQPEQPALSPAPPANPVKPAPPPAQPGQPTPPPVSSYDTDLNNYVQQLITTYKGFYPYLLNNDYANYNGVTETLQFKNRVLARAHPSGNRASHCVGVTFEVFFKAMQERNRKLGLPVDDFNGMTFDELYDFLLIWYVASGNKRTSNIEVAVEKYGLGTRISRFEDAKAGDFMDISRSNGTGHTVVFQNWVRDNSGRIIGVHYWSSQGSTNGIGYETEYFDSSGRGNVLSNMVYIARVLPVHQYKRYK